LNIRNQESPLLSSGLFSCAHAALYHRRPMNPLLPRWSSIAKPVIGMLHLPALPGAPLSRRSILEITEQMLKDAEALSDGGVHGLMMENFGDVPFYPGRVPAHVVAHMTSIAYQVRKRFYLQLGINVLRNDGLSALAVAHASGADFIRVNVLCGARVTDQGIIQGIAHDLLRERVILGASHIKMMADVDVKHSAALAPRPIEDEVDDTLERGLADALIVSGAGTGKATDPAKAKQVKARAGNTPVFIGSGASSATVPSLLPHVDGFIVGTAFKRDGVACNPVDSARVRQFMQALQNG
jgi:membrane complex biogenesis BtpA family protein